jgi:hypothetical protein
MESASNRTSLVTEQLPDDRRRRDQHGKDGATTDPVHSSPPRSRIQSGSRAPSLGETKAQEGRMNRIGRLAIFAILLIVVLLVIWPLGDSGSINS